MLEAKLTLAKDFVRVILKNVPGLPWNFALFKASEFAMIVNHSELMAKFLADCRSGSAMDELVRGKWEIPASTSVDQLQLYDILRQGFMQTRIDFLSESLVDADPIFLEHQLREKIGKFLQYNYFK